MDALIYGQDQTQVKGLTLPSKTDFDWWKERASLLKGSENKAEEMYKRTQQAYQVGPQAIMKLALLGYYIQVYTNILGPSGITNYVDLFAGPGINEIKGTNQRIIGSALLAKQAPRRHKFTNIFLCELKQEYAKALTTLLPDAKVINKDINGEGLVELADFLESNRGHSLVFADPEGLDLHFKTLTKIFEVAYCDVLINYQPTSVNRVLGQVPQNPRMGASLTDFFGTTDWIDNGNGEQLLDLYCLKIKDFRENVVTVKVRGMGAFHYYIVLATRRVQRYSPAQEKWVESFVRGKERVERADAQMAKTFVEIVTGSQKSLEVGEYD